MLFSLISSCGLVKNNSRQSSQQPKFAWDFSHENKYEYSQKTTISTAFRTAKDGPLLKSLIVENGNIVVQAKPNHLADFSRTNLKVNYKWFKEDGTLNDSTTLDIPTKTIQNIGEKGIFDESEIGLYFKLLMPLPESDVTKGETFKIPLRMPVEDNPTWFNEGVNTIRFTDVKMIQGNKCAVLKGLVDISNLNLKEDYNQTITGSATYYFDLGKQRFIGADITMVEESLNKLKTNKPEFYVMSSNTVIKVRLAGITDPLIAN